MDEVTDGLRNQPQLGRLLYETGDVQPLVAGALQVFEVLLERCFIELCQKLGLGGTIEAADVVDELTFIHDGFNFATGKL
jgi:hypothetical protein